MAEASILSTEGQQSISSTVINRMYSDEFPNTLTGVVYQRNAFSVTFNGALFRHKPSESVIKAVRMSLYEDNSEGSLYFLNPQLAIDQGYEKNVRLMMNAFDKTVTHGSVVFLK